MTWVGEQQLGEQWPLTVPSGNLRVRRYAMLFTPAGSRTTYTVNGVAVARHPSMPHISTIARPVDGGHMDLGPLIQLLPRRER